jgi:hypothetical protein
MAVRDRRSSSSERHFRGRWLHRTAQQNEAPPAEAYCSLEEGVPGRAAPAVFGFPQRGELHGEQTVWFCSGGIRNTQSTTCIPLSFRAFCNSHGQGCQPQLLKIPLKIPDFLPNSPEYNRRKKFP